MDNAKPCCIAKRDVWDAYKRVKANQGAAGVDGQAIEQFEEEVEHTSIGCGIECAPAVMSRRRCAG